MLQPRQELPGLREQMRACGEDLERSSGDSAKQEESSRYTNGSPMRKRGESSLISGVPSGSAFLFGSDP